MRFATLYPDTCPEGVTIRHAGWIASIRRAMENADAGEICWMADQYAERERWSVIEDAPLYTADLDFRLSFAPGKSEREERLYNLAVDYGIIPSVPSGPSGADGPPQAGQGPEERILAYRQVLEAKNGATGDGEDFIGRINAIESIVPVEHQDEFGIIAGLLYRGWEKNRWSDEEVLRATETLAFILRAQSEDDPVDGPPGHFGPQ